MNVEVISIAGEKVVTLKELIRPGLRAVFVGINPSPHSVAAGHYYQGRLGRRLWTRIQTAGIAHDLLSGEEDDAAFNQGLGFADLVRRPAPRSDDISDEELRKGAETLSERIAVASDAVVVFVFKRAFDAAAGRLVSDGWSVARMPAPYERRELAARKMAELGQLIPAR